MSISKFTSTRYQLFYICDQVVNKNTVFVIGITSKRDNLDPGLRRPNRLDREIEFGVPPAEERTEV